MHLGLMIYEIINMTNRINQKYLHSETRTRLRMNVATTSIHILVILAIAIIYLMYAITSNEVIYHKILTSAVFLVGIQDLFVICMLWLVMDS